MVIKASFFRKKERETLLFLAIYNINKIKKNMTKMKNLKKLERKERKKIGNLVV